MILSDVGRKVPLVVVFAGMCLGIFSFLGDVPLACFSLFFLILLFRKDRVFQTCLGIALGLGAIWLAPPFAPYPDGDYPVSGRVAEAGFMHGTFRIVLDDVEVGGQRQPGLALLNVYDGVKEPGRGSRLSGTVRIRPRQGLGNEGEFDYRTYLLSQGITVAGSVRDLGCMTLTGPGKADNLKSRLVAVLTRDARPEAEILNASLTGDRSGLVYSLQDRFSSLGITHLIAISGLNMGVVFFMGYAIVLFFLRLLPPVAVRLDTPLAAKAAGLVCVVSYAWFVGYSPPTFRAAVMVCAFVASFILRRKPCLLESLAFSGIVILVWMPYSLYSASFLLSFSAVLGIIGMHGKMEGLPRWSMAAAMPVVSLAFTGPIVMYLFGFLSPVTIPANLVFVPWFSVVVMPLGLAGLMTLPVSEPLATHLLSLAFDGIGIMLRSAELFGSLEPVARPSLSWVLACQAALIAALFGRAGALRTLLCTAGVLLIVSLPAAARISRDGEALCFDFISAGQADSILVTRGTNAVLIDAGSSFGGSDAGRFIVAPHLLRRGVTKIDLVVMTHSHPDHIGGMPFILERFRVGEIWTNVGSDWDPNFLSAMRIALRKSIPVRNVCLGDGRELGGLMLRVLSPPKRIPERTGDLDINLNSVVLKISDASMRGLLMADAGDLGEIRLCRLEEDISAEVLKVAHHGSKQTCLDMFLQKVRPSCAVVTAGLHNPFRLPHEKALARLRDRGIAIYRTDLDGEVKISAAGGHLQVKSGINPADKGSYSASRGTH